MPTWTFTAPLPCAPVTPNDRMHYRTRAERNSRIRRTVEIVARSERNRLQPPEPTGVRDLGIVWHRPGRRGLNLLDDDNAVAAMKPVRDAIADAGWLLGGHDGAKSLRHYAVTQAACERREHVTVTVTEP